MLQAYKSCVRPIWEYNSSGFSGTYDQNNILIEMSWSLAIMIISYAPRMCSVTSAKDLLEYEAVDVNMLMLLHDWTCCYIRSVICCLSI